jgi:hypothetical protein
LAKQNLAELKDIDAYDFVMLNKILINCGYSVG